MHKERIKQLRLAFEDYSDKKFLKDVMIELIIEVDPFCRVLCGDVPLGIKQDYEEYLKSCDADEIFNYFVKYEYFSLEKDETFIEMMEKLESELNI
jgi:hypothetical protein